MKNKLLKNSHVIGIVISLLLIISMFSTIGLAERNEIESNGINTLIFNDELDQSQTYQDHWWPIGLDAIAAQSFVPQLNILTRIELYLTKDEGPPPPSLPLQFAIRDSLSGENLAHGSISPGQVPGFPTMAWIEIDFDDISVTAGQTYYIVGYSDEYDSVYIWGVGMGNPYPYGLMQGSLEGGEWIEYPDIDACFKTYGRNDADLSCEGSLSWTDVQGGATVEGSFTVENIGGSGTLLDWEIESYPDWGAWTFDPDVGTGLTPGNGAITVDVEVLAPPEEETEFEGEIRIVNSENSGDYCIIDVSLVTPVNQQNSHPLFQRFLDIFPNAFPILRQILGL